MADSTVVFGEVVRVQDVRQSGNSKVKNFALKSVRKYRDREFSKYFQCGLWGAKSSTDLYVGQPVAVQGEIKASAYIDKDGKPKARLELSVRDIVAGIHEPEPESDAPSWATEGLEDDIPL